jgi:colicin import membrane protein
MTPATLLSLLVHGAFFAMILVVTMESNVVNLNGTPDGKAMMTAELLKGPGGDPKKPDRLATSRNPTGNPDDEPGDKAEPEIPEKAAPEKPMDIPEPAAPEPAAPPPVEKPAATPTPPEPPKATPAPEKKVEKTKEPEKPKPVDDDAIKIDKKKEEAKKEALKKEQAKKEEEAKKEEAKKEEARKQEKAAEAAALAEAKKRKEAALTPDRARNLRPVPTNPDRISDAKSGKGSGSSKDGVTAALAAYHDKLKKAGKGSGGGVLGDGRPGGGGPATGAKLGGNPLGEANEGPTSLKGMGLPDSYAREALNRVARYFIVPPDKEQSLTCMIGLTINRSGKLSNIRVSRSSGNQELDQIALDALNSTGNFPPFPDDFEKDSADVDISFSFTK